MKPSTHTHTTWEITHIRYTVTPPITSNKCNPSTRTYRCPSTTKSHYSRQYHLPLNTSHSASQPVLYIHLSIHFLVQVVRVPISFLFRFASACVTCVGIVFKLYYSLYSSCCSVFLFAVLLCVYVYSVPSAMYVSLHLATQLLDVVAVRYIYYTVKHTVYSKR